MSHLGIVLLASAATARIVVAPGALPQGARIEVVSLATGAVATQEVGIEEVALPAPEGEVVLSVFSPNGTARGFSKIAIKPGKDLKVVDPPAPARGHAQLSVELSLPRDAARGRKEVAVFLVTHDKKLRPDVFVDADASRFSAFWLAAPRGPIRVVAESKRWTLSKPLESEIPDRGAIALRGWVVPKPTLTVRFQASDSARHGLAEVELLDCEKQAGHAGPLPVPLCTLRATESGPTNGTFEFHDLDPALYALRWTRGPMRDTLPVDLHDARSLEIEIPLRTFDVAGRVTAGGKEVPASLVWEPPNSGLTFEAKADDDGQYRLALVRRGRYLVRISVEGLETDTEAVSFEGDDPRDERRDFDIPANHVTVRVLDSETTQPIPASSVYWSPIDPLPGGGVSKADEAGAVVLPPLRKGRWEVNAWAKGYREGPAAVVDVDEKTRERTLDVRLHKGKGLRIRVLDPEGAPAAGGILNGQVAGTGGTFGGFVDGEGFVTVDEPISLGQPFSAWDARGSLGVFRWSGEEEQVVRIPASGPPFTVLFLSEDGRARPGWVAMFSIDGIPVSYYADRQRRAGGDVAAGADGRQVLAGLPPFGTVTLSPAWKSDAAVTRALPIVEEIVFTVPPAPGR
jgi:hypothetical protein